ncbi:DUF3883 domain-containing protein [Phyllobacteriaceae bacterium JZ32]
MDFAALLAALTVRLDEGGRGDRAWWLLTRVHLSAVRLQQIAAYLLDAGADAELELTPAHYANLATMLDIATANPAQGINRHYFLAMDTPLRLLARADGVHWNRIALTGPGVALATDPDTSGILEDQLRDIRFCRVPWYNQQRVAEYPEFDIRPYDAILAVMAASGGYVDVDEFDLFVSRIRIEAEIADAIERIATFRTLDNGQKQTLRNLVADRMPAGTGNDPHKPYNNWRDMGRHTFSLLSLGESAVQVDNRLYLAALLAAPIQPEAAQEGAVEAAPAVPAPPAQQPPAGTVLRIPDSEAPDELLTPPGVPQTNSGTEAELLVGKIFAAAGWEVVYYNQRRGYGFDLWVRKDGQAFVVEVKSFVGQGGSVTLTALEHQAAQHHGENFLLVIVENATGSSPTLHVIQNPAAALAFNQAQILQFSVGRAEWLQATAELEP